MPNVRCTAYFRDDDGHGWSESHDRDGGPEPVNLTSINAAFDNLMKTLRVPLLAGDGYYIGCRTSYKLSGGKIATAPLLLDLPMRGTSKIGNEDIYMSDASLAIKLRLQNNSSTANSDIYLRGIWDQVILAGQMNFGSTIGDIFKQGLDGYRAALCGGIYGWIGINSVTTPRGIVTGYAQNEGGSVTFGIIVTNGVTMPPNLSRISVNFSRINNSKSILNRTIVCEVISPTTLKTVEPIGVTEYISGGNFVIPQKTLIPYDHLAYHKVARRKTGRPFGVGPGRRSVQTLH